MIKKMEVFDAQLFSSNPIKNLDLYLIAMPNRTGVEGGTEVFVEKYFLEIIKRWCRDSRLDVS